LDPFPYVVYEIGLESQYIETHQNDGIPVALYDKRPSIKIVMNALANTLAGGKTRQRRADRG
jgi:hypothetical protein